MFRLIRIFTFIQISISPLLCQDTSETTLIRNKYAYMADRGLLPKVTHQCLSNLHKKVQILNQNMETLIDYIERLEDYLDNTTDPILQKFKNPKDVSRLILHRFNFEGIDFTNLEQLQFVQKRAEIDTHILGLSDLVELDYYFPDNIYNLDELCTMLFMFSNVLIKTEESTPNRHFRRETYIFDRNSYANSMVQHNSYSKYSIQEKGVVSFHQDEFEAIVPSKVLIGIIAALSNKYNIQAKEIAQTMGKTGFKDPIIFKDALLTTTLANIHGTAILYDLDNFYYNEKLVFGVTGKWIDRTGCCTQYVITDSVSKFDSLKYSNRGSLALIRGALDGYIIGKNLRKIGDTQIRLSTILRSYYSMPHARNGSIDFGVSYCDRPFEKPSKNDLDNEAINYSVLFRYLQDLEEINSKINLFHRAYERSSQVQNNFCQNRPTPNLDKNSPCETPSDLIFVIDPKHENLNKTLMLIDEITSKINKIGKHAGTISVFINTNSKTNVDLPHGPSGWPFPALIFNSTNIGSIFCAFKRENIFFSPETNFGKYFKKLNQTIFHYKWWSPRRFLNGVPSKNVIIIDYDSLKSPTDPKDKDDYNDFKDKLKYQNPDVRYLIFSNDRKNFIDILDRKDDLVSYNQTQMRTAFEKRICDNPATLIYNGCHDKVSDDVVYNGFVSPGYKQNWVMYPEYFLKSHDIEIKIKAHDGAIKYCFDRKFPPEQQGHCKNLIMSNEETIFISNPCHYESVYSCKPFYFTVFGKEKTTPCKDIACQSLDQIKFSITHKGISCNSSLRIEAIFILQFICFLLVYNSFNYFV